MTERTLSRLDHALIEIERALGTIFEPVPAAMRPSPAESIPDAPLDDAARRHSAGLMRVNHVGEVCAQALYFGQAAVAHDDTQRARMLEAAAEETDHLAWCGERLRELDSRPSLLNPLWYVGSYAIGAAAGLISEAHLGEHLEKLPADDARSRTIVHAMKEDEARHADKALAAGAQSLPAPVPDLMRFASWVMKTVAYRI